MYGQPSVFRALNVFDICIVSLLSLLKLYCILKIEGGFLKPWKPPSLCPWQVYLPYCAGACMILPIPRLVHLLSLHSLLYLPVVLPG